VFSLQLAGTIDNLPDVDTLVVEDPPEGPPQAFRSRLRVSGGAVESVGSSRCNLLPLGSVIHAQCGFGGFSQAELDQQIDDFEEAGPFWFESLAA
jgi:hypothetical protein